MRRVVKSAADLKRVALAKGAAVTSPNGAKFNTARTAAKPLPKPKAKPVPVTATETDLPATPPPPATVNPVLDNALLERVTDIAASMQVDSGVTRELVRQMKDLAVPKTPVHKWIFDVERDQHGFIERIIATDASVEPV